MTIEDSIKAAMAKYVERIQGISGVEVTSWEEEFDVYSYGGCETCGPEYEKEYTVTINYIWENSRRAVTHSGSFTELIRELDS